jgi:hypothetical protein
MRLTSIAGAAALLLALGGGARAQQLPVVVDSVNLVNPLLDANGVLTAAQGTVTGTLAGLPFETDITNFALDLFPAQAPGCAILNLELAPIHLALLGLHVDTSAICLDITANPAGGLLGNLLCGLAGLDLTGILGGLLGELPLLQGNSLLSSIVSQSLGEALNHAQRRDQANGNGRGHAAAEDSVCTGECEILHLVLGPVDLNLLGLEVALDDCADGPVQVCVSATRSEGILGALLCALAGPQLPGLSLADIIQFVDQAQALLEDGVLSNADIHALRQLLHQLLNV